MTNSKKIIIIATLIHLSAIVYGSIKGYWDAVILAIVFLVASLMYGLNKDKKILNEN
jgi:archaellum component FlaF (FlaF/FlaG flagellin family)